MVGYAGDQRPHWARCEDHRFMRSQLREKIG